MDKIRILVVDDHAVVRQGLAAMLSPRQGMEVVGEAENGREALRLAKELEPDVIIMDLHMPEMDGLKTTVAIREQNLTSRILILTSFDDQNRVAESMAAGAFGYLMKDSSTDELLQAIRSVHSGHLVLSPHIMQTLSSAPSKPELEEPVVTTLTPREVEVLQGIVEGLTNKAIASKLGVSDTTVRSHVSTILTKLNVSNRTQAALFAQEHQLL